MIKNRQDAAKVVLRKKFTAIQAHQGKKKNQLQINNLTLHLKELEEEEQEKPKVKEGKKS